MKPQTPKSHTGRYIPTKMDVEKAKSDGWHRDGILVVSADEIKLSWPEREFITQIGNKLYGEKKS